MCTASRSPSKACPPSRPSLADALRDRTLSRGDDVCQVAGFKKIELSTTTIAVIVAAASHAGGRCPGGGQCRRCYRPRSTLFCRLSRQRDTSFWQFAVMGLKIVSSPSFITVNYRPVSSNRH